MNEKELNEKDLQKVSGGKGTGYASAEHLPADHGEHISEWEAVNYKNQEVYFVNDLDTYMYGYGTLVDSTHGDDLGCYRHTIFVKYYGGNEVIKTNQNQIILSNLHTLYKKNSD